MKTIKLKLSSKIAILAFVLSLLGITALAFISYYQSNKIFKNNLVKDISFEVEKTSFNFEKEISEAKKNVLFISNSEPVFGILRTTRNRYNYDEDENMHLNSWKDRLEKLFVIIMEQNPSYFQVRLIGLKDEGKELIRIEKEKDKFILIKEKNLQSKKNTPYFNDTMNLDNGEIYISRINLNREHNILVTPYVPTIRVATPIYHIKDDNSHDIFGIIVININVTELFNFKSFEKNKNLQTFVTNEEGEYLYNKDADKTFGFEFGRQYLIQDEFAVGDFIAQTGLDKKKKRRRKEKKKSKKYKEKTFSFYDEKQQSAIAIEKIHFLENRFIYILQVANSDFLNQESEVYIKILIIYIVIIAISIALLISFLIRLLTAPIAQLTSVAKKITNGEKIDAFSLDIKSGDEIEELATSFKYMLDSLSQSKAELQRLADNLELDVTDKTRALQKLNNELEKKVTDGIENLRKKDEALQHQSKLASMGEMIGAIAHQWRQPLNELGISIQNLKFHYKNNEIDETFIEEYIQKNKKTIQFMSKTIDDFRNFFRVDKQKADFLVKETIESVVSMQSAQLENYDIELTISGDDFEFHGLQSEFQQVILNILNNAKDVLIEKEIQNPVIEINIDAEHARISLKDNAGGIDKTIIDRVFEPYFTTKEQGKGTGMGLYMSKMIIEENMGGHLHIENRDKGACFIITLHARGR